MKTETTADAGHSADLPILARDGSLHSPWQSIKGQKDKETAIDEDIVYDVLIIGAGITGLSAALMLQEDGKKCILAEAHSVGFGTTGGTSAHINNFADTTFKEAEDAFGKEGALIFAKALQEGFDIVHEQVVKYKIACDYEKKQGYVYASNADELHELHELYEAAARVKVQVHYIKDVPTPIHYLKAIVFDEQAQFHPLKYLLALQKAYLKAGGQLRENCLVDGIKSVDHIHTASIGNRVIKAKNVIYATHIPPGINAFSFRCAPYRSYVMAVTLRDRVYPDALVYDMQEPYHYFRTHIIDGQEYLVAGGNDHKTGHEDSEKAFAELETYLRKHYDVEEIKYKWSSQYYVPVDGFPYIGQLPGHAEGIYCATGYNGNGMTLGSLAAKILHHVIMKRKHAYEVFDPSRLKLVAGFTDFVKENADVVYHFVADRFSVPEIDSLKRIKPGTGKIVAFDNHKMAVYRDEAGVIHALNPVCTHAHCIVNWNPSEKSWDCPCHGARFDIDGKVLNGPADKDLQKLNVKL